MPDEKDVQLNLTGSIQDLANSNLNQPRTTNTGFQTNSVVSNLTSQPNANNSSGGNQPFTATQFTKLMDVLATMTNRLETAHQRTHTLLEKMNLSLATRLESIYKQMVISNKMTEMVNKRQQEMQKESENNISNLTFRLSGFLGVLGQDFRNSILNMQRFMSTQDTGEAARLSLIRVLGQSSFLKGIIGYEAEAFKGRMRPMPFTYELYHIVSQLPYYFDNISQNLITYDKQLQDKVLNIRHKEITDRLKALTDIGVGIRMATVDTSFMLQEFAHSIYPNRSDRISSMYEKYGTNLTKVQESMKSFSKETIKYQGEQLNAFRDFKVTLTDKLDDVLKQTISMGQGLFQIGKYLLSPKSLFGKLFWGYLSYRSMAKLLMPLFSQIYDKTSPVVTVVKDTMYSAARGLLSHLGLEKGESVRTFISDGFKNVWLNYMWPGLEKLLSTAIVAFGAMNVLRKGVAGGMLTGRGSLARRQDIAHGGMVSSGRNLTASLGKRAAGSQTGSLAARTSGIVLGSAGRLFQSTGLLGVGEIGSSMVGMAGGLTMVDDKDTHEKITKQARGYIGKLSQGFVKQAYMIGDAIINPGGGADRSKRATAYATKGSGLLSKLSKGFGGLYKGLGKFAKLIPMLGPVAIGLSIAMPMLSSGIDMIKNVFLPKIFGNKENIPGDVKNLVSGSIKRIFDAILSTAGTFIMNLPSYLATMGKVVKDIAVGLVEGIVYMVVSVIKKIPDIIIGAIKLSGIMVKMLWEKIIDVILLPLNWLFGIGKAKTERARQQSANTVIQTNQEVIKETKKQTDAVEKQGTLLNRLIGYFSEGKFKEDITSMASGAGSVFRKIGEFVSSVKDLSTGKIGGLITSFGSTLGGFINGLMGDNNKAVDFLSRAQSIASQRGYRGVASMFGSARESVLTLMQKSVSVESAAAEKMFNAGVLMESAANKAAGRESGWSSRTASSNTQAGFIAAAGSTETTSGYGWRTHPITGKRSFHGGVDIKIPSGTPLYSLFDGQVISSGYQDNIGNFVKIKHPSRNITSLYGHLSELGVKAGDKVYAGQPIGVSGATGRVTGPHLHLAFQDMQTGTSLDPNVVLKNTPLAFNKENLDEAFLQRLKDSGKFAQVKYKGTAHYISALGELSAQDLAVKLGISETAAKRMKNGEIDKNVAGLGTLNIGSVINMHSENNATAVSEETKREEESSSSKEQAYHRIYMPAIDSGIL